MIDLLYLVWDEWNISHIARHGVTQGEVDFAIQSSPVFYKATYKGRVMLLGQTIDERVLAMVVGPVPDGPNGAYYLFTARTAKRRERSDYIELKGSSAS